MKEKIKKILYYLSNNSRITTKELGKKINISQQSVSYLVNNLKSKKLLLGSVCIVDPSKLGFIRTIVAYNFLKINNEEKDIVLEKLKEIKEIIYIEEGVEGIDLIVEFATTNLSKFHKIHEKIINDFWKYIRTLFVFPVIISYDFNKNYLLKEKIFKEIILSDDEYTSGLRENEKNVLYSLVKNPSVSLVDISEDNKISAKSVITIKKNLEKRSIIKGYSSIFNYKDLEIDRKIIFLRFFSDGIKDIEEFKDFCANHKNIVRFIRLIGSSQVMIDVESLKDIDIIRDIRTNFSIENYLIMRSEKIHKKRYLPV